MLQEISAATLGFIQWAGMPLYVLLAQAAARRLLGSLLVVDMLLAVGVIATVVVVPLQLLGFIPLGVNITAYALGSLVGGLVAVPVTRLVRARTAL